MMGKLLLACSLLTALSCSPPPSLSLGEKVTEQEGKKPKKEERKKEERKKDREEFHFMTTWNATDLRANIAISIQRDPTYLRNVLPRFQLMLQRAIERERLFPEQEFHFIFHSQSSGNLPEIELNRDFHWFQNNFSSVLENLPGPPILRGSSFEGSLASDFSMTFGAHLLNPDLNPLQTLSLSLKFWDEKLLPREGRDCPGGVSEAQCSRRKKNEWFLKKVDAFRKSQKSDRALLYYFFVNSCESNIQKTPREGKEYQDYPGAEPIFSHLNLCHLRLRGDINSFREQEARVSEKLEEVMGWKKLHCWPIPERTTVLVDGREIERERFDIQGPYLRVRSPLTVHSRIEAHGRCSEGP